MKNRKHIISSVIPGSIAEELGLEEGRYSAGNKSDAGGGYLRLSVSYE